MFSPCDGVGYSRTRSMLVVSPNIRVKKICKHVLEKLGVLCLLS